MTELSHDDVYYLSAAIYGATMGMEVPADDAKAPEWIASTWPKIADQVAVAVPHLKDIKAEWPDVHGEMWAAFSRLWRAQHGGEPRQVKEDHRIDEPGSYWIAYGNRQVQIVARDDGTLTVYGFRNDDPTSGIGDLGTEVFGETL